MSKNRLENLSDAVFAIVLTLLVIEIHVPLIEDPHSARALVDSLLHIVPLFGAYFTSFIILTMFWISHHGFYTTFVRNVNRQLILLNMVYLMFIALIPFSAHLIGSYSLNQTAILVYGTHIMVIAIMARIIVGYALSAHEVRNTEMNTRIINQGKIRVTLPIIFCALGILVSFVSIPVAYALFAFPVIFNIIPGTLDAAERILGIRLD